MISLSAVRCADDRLQVGWKSTRAKEAVNVITVFFEVANVVWTKHVLEIIIGRFTTNDIRNHGITVKDELFWFFQLDLWSTSKLVVDGFAEVFS